MMPILQPPGVMTPGQLGPMSTAPLSSMCRFTYTMSRTGMPSVMHTTRGSPASTDSTMASAANGGGTKMSEAFAPVSRAASATVLNTGTPSASCPPLPGVTPATTAPPPPANSRLYF